jgi:small subunit ribosomal protein S20
LAVDRSPSAREEAHLPNTKSAAKAARQAERRRRRNQPIRTAAKTYVRKARTAIADGATDDALAAVVKAQSYLDSAATKGVIHKNNAARRKSRLMKRLNAMQAEQAAQG